MPPCESLVITIGTTLSLLHPDKDLTQSIFLLQVSLWLDGAIKSGHCLKLGDLKTKDFSSELFEGCLASC